MVLKNKTKFSVSIILSCLCVHAHFGPRSFRKFGIDVSNDNWIKLRILMDLQRQRTTKNYKEVQSTKYKEQKVK